MSGFKETFTKEEGGEKNLDYDDSAFFYFALVIEIIVFIPLVYTFIKSRIFGTAPSGPSITNLDPKTRNCKCSKCAQSLQSIYTSHKSESKKFGIKGFCHLLFIILTSYLLYLTIISIWESPAGIKRFDPYEILGVEIGATEKQIRSAFRELSKVFHPDKNIGNNWAAGKYIQITKAYETLTSELARSNYEKYGNPDGPSPVRVRFT